MSAHRQLLFDLATRLGWRLPALIVLTMLVGLTEGSSVVLFLPLLNRISVGFTSSHGPAIAVLEDGLDLIGATEPVEILAAIIVVAAVQAALFIAVYWWHAKLIRRYQRQRQSELFRAYMRAKWTFIAGEKVGELTNAIVTEANRWATAFTFALSVLSTAVIILIYAAISFLVAWPVVLSLIVLATLAALTMVPIFKKSYAVGQTLAPLNAELQSAVGEHLAGIKIVKATASEDRAVARVDHVLRRLERAYVLGNFLPGMVRGLFEFLALAGISVIFVLGNQAMDVGLGDAVVVLALFARLFPRLTTLQANIHYLNNNVHAVEALDRLQFAAEVEAEQKNDLPGYSMFGLPTSLKVQNLEVTFEQRKVLEGINLNFAMPGTLAIVGGSGAGKSTLVHAVLGLVEPSAGSLRLGPYELGSVSLGAWRRAIGYVPQETILFHASVWENLTLANPDASEAEVKTAVRRAHADRFIEALPQGYQTVIGDQGVKLSGGQRQRLAIARALLTNPVLLLLDEAMSALDAESESELINTLEAVRKEIGILIVAHRLAAVRTADTICVLEGGRVAALGTWNELMARRSKLYSLATAQLAGQERFVEGRLAQERSAQEQSAQERSAEAL
jgi:ATP-binding cassette subfamily C protein